MWTVVATGWPVQLTGFAMFEPVSPIGAVLLLMAYPVYVLVMGAVLAILGVARRDIARWALRQADRQHVADLIRTVRGPGGAEPAASVNRPGCNGEDGEGRTGAELDQPPRLGS